MTFAALYSTGDNMKLPLKIPSVPPIIEHTSAKKTYLKIIAKEEYPNVFKHADTGRSSSTSLVMVVAAVSAATAIKNTGKIKASVLILSAAASIIAAFPGAELVDDPAGRKYPTPLDFAEKAKCGVGRVRADTAFENGLSFWVSGDNLWKGAALNAVQNAELMVREGLLPRL